MGKRRGNGKKSVVGMCGRCHICRLPIFAELIASRDHPLSGTIDHVIPVSRGGKDAPENRRASHNYCNGFKGSQRGI
jgi:5-methylcytosine-specific restriction endonuclease McrA